MAIRAAVVLALALLVSAAAQDAIDRDAYAREHVRFLVRRLGFARFATGRIRRGEHGQGQLA